jgi:hypothetical protein
MGVQELFLFLRQTPYGTPYVDRLSRFLPAALIWNLWAALLPALPFLGWWLTRWGREVVPAQARRTHFGLLGLLCLATVLDQVDNELMRFMGLHLSFSVVITYGNVAAWSGCCLFLRTGGALLPLLCSPAAMVLAWSGHGCLPALRASSRSPRHLVLGVLGAMALLSACGSSGPTAILARVKPALPAIYGETGASAGDRLDTAPATRRWLAASADTAQAFPDTAFRVPHQPPRPSRLRPQLHLHPAGDLPRMGCGLPRPIGLHATPFLDSLARAQSPRLQPELQAGPSTASSRGSAPSNRTGGVTHGVFTTTRFRCLRGVRAHGWRAEFITGVDPDWFQTIWLPLVRHLDVPQRGG